MEKFQNYSAIYESLKHSYNMCSKESYKSKVFSTLRDVGNVYEFFCNSISNDRAFGVNNLKTPTSQFVLNFEEYVKTDYEKYTTLLTNSLKLQGYQFMKISLNHQLQKSLAYCFKLHSCPDILTHRILNDLKNTKEVIHYSKIVKALKFQENYSIYEFVIPLFIQDRPQDLENFIDGCPKLQKEFLSMLDKIVGKEIQVSDLVYDCKIKRLSLKGKDDKSISKYAQRLMKQFPPDIPQEILCPNIASKQKLSSIKHLFCRHYLEYEISQESVILFLQEICFDSDKLICEVLNLFVDYNDCYSAVIFLEKIDCPSNLIPYQVKDLLNNESLLKLEKKRYEAEKATYFNPHMFYSSSILDESIIQVKTSSEFDNSVAQILNYSLIGLDVEWKPAFFSYQTEELGLLQIATYDKVYLFCIPFLSKVLSENQWYKLYSLLCDSALKIITYGFLQDAKVLYKLFSKYKFGNIKLKDTIDLDKSKICIIESCPKYFSYNDNTAIKFKGLSNLVYLCFGKPLSKLEQCSYWTANTLSKEQVMYAATDAFCLLQIFDYLNGRKNKFKLPDWISLTKKWDSTTDSSKDDKTKKNSFSKLKCHAENRPTILASKFRIVCDTMIQGLGKLLRQCNLDTIILEQTDDHDKCIDYYERNKRAVLTRGSAYDRIRKFVPETHVLKLSSDDVHSQLSEVVTYFNLKISESDIFGRCCHCNSNVFINIPSKILNESTRPPDHPEVFEDKERGFINLISMMTNKGGFVRDGEVHEAVLSKVSIIYVCAECGRCYWDGSHWGKVKKKLEYVISDESEPGTSKGIETK